MKRLPLRTVIVGAFFIGALVTLIVGGASFWMITQNDEAIKDLAADRLIVDELVPSMKNCLLMHRRYEKDIFLNIGTVDKQEGYRKKFNTQADLMRSLITTFEDSIKTNSDFPDKLRSLSVGLRPNYEAYNTGAKSVFEKVINDSTISAVEANVLIKPTKSSSQAFEKIMTAFSEDGHALIAAKEEGLHDLNILGETIMLIGIPASVIGVILLAFFISNHVKRSLETPVTALDQVAFKGKANIVIDAEGRTDEIGALLKAIKAVLEMVDDKSKLANAIASGDLTRDVNVLSDEDQLGSAFKKMSQDLSNFFRMLFDTATNINDSAGGIQASSEGLSQATTQQAASIEEISSTLTEIATQSNTNAQNADQAQALSSETRQSAEQGNEHMRGMVMAMQEINDSSDQIAKIIKVIDDIAFQTNLLALNAAVEAARAGRHGKGFAVVAEEVRNLAGRSAKAARETADLIQSSGDKVKKGSEIANMTSTSLEEIVSSAIKTTDLISEIAAASREQALGVEQINEGVSQMENATQQNSANAEETASAATELKSMADSLHAQLSHFKLTSGGPSGRSSTSTPAATFSQQAQPKASSSSPMAALPPSPAKPRQQGDLFTWTSEFSVGVDKFDMQHKVLFDMINKLHKALKSGKADSILGPILVELAEYTTTHFAEEEAMFRVHKYPDTEAHIKIHKELLSQVASVKERFDKGQHLGIEVMHFLKDWLLNHIQKVDKKYTEFFRAKNIPGTGAVQAKSAPPPVPKKEEENPEDIISLDNDDWGRY